MSAAAQEGLGCMSWKVLASSCPGRWMLGLALLQGAEGLSSLGIGGPCFWAVNSSVALTLCSICRACSYVLSFGVLRSEGSGLSWAPLLL